MADRCEWDAAGYHEVSRPQIAWGEAVLEQLVVRGDERAIDVGCGSGHLTRRLAMRLPRGRVVALDRSATMLAQLRLTLSEPAARAAPVALVRADGAALPIRGWADLVFSTATFHWIPDHEALFASVFAALAPGGRLWAQCGGGANLARFHARAETIMRSPAFAPYFVDWRPPWNFQDEHATAARLRRAGFIDVVTSLVPAPTSFPDAPAYQAFIRAVVAHPHLALLPSGALGQSFLDELTREAAAGRPPFLLDYWRLNMRARRPEV